MFRNILIAFNVLFCSAFSAIVAFGNLDKTVGLENIWHPWFNQMVLFRNDLKDIVLSTMGGCAVIMIIMNIVINKCFKHTGNYFSLIFCALVGILVSYDFVCAFRLNDPVLPIFTNSSFVGFLTILCIFSSILTYLFYYIKMRVTHFMCNPA